jgi:hypothetical protein
MENGIWAKTILSQASEPAPRQCHKLLKKNIPNKKTPQKGQSQKPGKTAGAPAPSKIHFLKLPRLPERSRQTLVLKHFFKLGQTL